MPISRLNNYTPGTSARGDHVQNEFDSVISFVNGLETSKLDATGGVVGNLTVTGAFTAQGTSIFNAGITVNNQKGVFNAGLDVLGGTLKTTVLEVDQVTKSNPATTAIGFGLPIILGDLSTANSQYVASVGYVQNRLQKTGNAGSDQGVLDTNVIIPTDGSGAAIVLLNTINANYTNFQDIGILSSKGTHNLGTGSPNEYLAFIEDGFGAFNDYSWFGRNNLKMAGGSSQEETLQITNQSVSFNNSFGATSSTVLNIIDGLVLNTNEGDTSHYAPTDLRLHRALHNSLFTIDVENNMDITGSTGNLKNINVNLNAANNMTFNLSPLGVLNMFLKNLPTSAPAGSKQVWSNGGVLTITP